MEEDEEEEEEGGVTKQARTSSGVREEECGGAEPPEALRVAWWAAGMLPQQPISVRWGGGLCVGLGRPGMDGE